MDAFSKQRRSYGALPFALFFYTFSVYDQCQWLAQLASFGKKTGSFFPLQLSNELLHITHKVWLSPPLSLKGLLCFLKKLLAS